MTKSYSRDLRRRVARFVEVDPSCHARHFEVSVAFVVRLMAAYRTTGSPAAKPKGGRRYSKLDPHRAFLIQRIAEKGDLTRYRAWPWFPRDADLGQAVPRGGCQDLRPCRRRDDDRGPHRRPRSLCRQPAAMSAAAVAFEPVQRNCLRRL